MKAVVYTRVSTDKIAQDSSLALQEEVYREYCDTEGYEFGGLYKDRATATSVRQRPDFIRMLADAGLDYVRNDEGYDNFKKSKRLPKFSLIIVKDVPRWSRNQHLGLMIIEYLRDKGVYVLFENAGLNTQDDDYHLRLSILFTVAQNESHAMSRRIKFSKRHNALGGRYNPARLPYGYMKTPAGIVINEDEAEVVKRIYQLYQNDGASTISRLLNEDGLKSQNGHNWSPDKVLRIIRNRIYTGTAYVGRSKKEKVTDTYRIDLPQDDWIEIPNAVSPIVTFKEWEEANQKRTKRINSSSKRGRKPAINDDFYGKIQCQCGTRFVRHQGRNNKNSDLKLTYMCQKRRKKGTGECSTRSVSFNILDDMFTKIEISTLFNDMGNSGYFKTLTKRLAKEAGHLNELIEELNIQIDTLKARNEKIADTIIDSFEGESKATISALSKKIDANQEKIDQLIEQRDKINIDTIHFISNQVDKKKLLIEEIKKGKSISREDKLKLLKSISVSEYQVEFQFFMPSFEEEVELFNSIFTNDPIKTTLSFKPFTIACKRNHKAAREYWKDVAENAQDAEEYFRNNPLI